MLRTPSVVLFCLALLGCNTSTPTARGDGATPAAGNASRETPPAVPAARFQVTAAILDRVLNELAEDDDRAVRPRAKKEREQLVALYAAADALWLYDDGPQTRDAEDALALLGTADAHGLRSADYAFTRLERLAHRLPLAETEPATRAQFEVLLSLQMMRYWRELHLGRVDPRAIGFRLETPVDDHDFPAMLRAAVAEHRLGAATDALAPPLVLYRSLVTALSRYREIAPRLPPLTVPAPAKSYKPGERVAGLTRLHERLLMLGDLPEGAPSPVEIYDGSIVEGVQRFQGRHGLAPDGVIGRGTYAALNVSLATRIEQLELALERLRWLPHLDESGFIAVNIPMFRLWAWGPSPHDGTPVFDMDVIVGRALDTETPVFTDWMEQVTFRPYWNVPRSILRGEVLPAMAKDASYLTRNNMEIAAGMGDGSPAVSMSETAMDGLREGRLRVRQRPGAKNSLGLVKFVFPNDDDIYMHGTPAPALFGRPRRDFSHGCIRLSDPVRLAEWVLRDQQAWTRERIVEAMEQGANSRSVRLTRPIQVILFYITAIVRPADGAVQFADDIYGHDRRLATEVF